LSGEPLNWRIKELYGEEATTPKTANKMAETYLKLREYQKEYMEYWNSTAKLTKSGKPVEAILTPVAPFAALQLDKTTSVGKNFRSLCSRSKLTGSAHRLYYFCECS
jgi:amidase